GPVPQDAEGTGSTNPPKWLTPICYAAAGPQCDRKRLMPLAVFCSKSRTVFSGPPDRRTSKPWRRPAQPVQEPRWSEMAARSGALLRNLVQRIGADRMDERLALRRLQ